jgi:Zn-dependent protease with chaperone function
MSKAVGSASVLRTYVVPALWLFALPAFSMWFSSYASERSDREVLAAIETNIQQSGELDRAEKESSLAFFRSVPATTACMSDTTELAGYREMLGDGCSDLKQFVWMGWLSLAALALGGVATVVALLSVAFAAVSRGAQYWSFTAGSRLLTGAGALQVVLQGVLATALSFWMTVLWMEVYSIKLILCVGVAAVVGVLGMIVVLFRKPSEALEVEGELLSESDAPELWARVRTLARKLDTSAPTHIIGGIDENFFVTEGTLDVAGTRVEGRMLYVSLSLLRILARSEADAVLAHELAHFREGDTAHGKQLAPALARFGRYLAELETHAVARPVFCFMRAYYALFLLSLRSGSRKAELLADQLAARVTSGRDVARSLVRVQAYARFVDGVQRSLFAIDAPHGELGLASRFVQGFAEYARSPNSHEELADAIAPHPFDTHPSLTERLANVGQPLAGRALADVLVARPEDSWTVTITSSAALEQRLWDRQEQRFAEAHALSLAYRYEPANDNERAHVSEHFPSLTFEGKNGLVVTLDHASITCSSWQRTLTLVDVTETVVGQIMFKKTLFVRTADEKLNISLNDLNDAEHLLECLGRYRGRSEAARQYAASKQSESTAA